MSYKGIALSHWYDNQNVNDHVRKITAWWSSKYYYSFADDQLFSQLAVYQIVNLLFFTQCSIEINLKS